MYNTVIQLQTHTHILFQILFPYGLLKNTEFPVLYNKSFRAIIN